jgi:hypothetical protein
MKFLSLKLFGCIFALLVFFISPTHAVTIIDDFQTGRGTFGAATGPFIHNPTPQIGAGIICKTRDVWLNPAEIPGRYVEAMTGAGAFIINSDLGQAIYSSLQYGSIVDRQLNANLSAENALSFRFRYVIQPLKLSISVATTTVVGTNPNGSAVSLDIPQSFTPKEVKVPFSAFATNSANNQPVDWGNVDSFLITFSGGSLPKNPRRAAFALEDIRAIGNPFLNRAKCS